jgi:hypothetical protein
LRGFADWSTPEDAYAIAEGGASAAYAAAGAAPLRFHEAEAPGARGDAGDAGGGRGLPRGSLG